jgi:hypothetical protein
MSVLVSDPLFNLDLAFAMSWIKNLLVGMRSVV